MGASNPACNYNVVASQGKSLTGTDRGAESYRMKVMMGGVCGGEGGRRPAGFIEENVHKGRRGRWGSTGKNWYVVIDCVP